MVMRIDPTQRVRHDAGHSRDWRALVRLPVRYAIRAGADLWGYVGLVTGGSISVGDKIAISPSRSRGGASRRATGWESFLGDTLLSLLELDRQGGAAG
jgi:sulfate adenylyltransferase subunit 1 (EFTu-like GTPase family)